MTYRGAIAITDTKVIMVTGTNAFKNASLIMFQKISNILSIASFVLIVSSLTSAFIGYKYLSSEQFKNKLMKQIMNNNIKILLILILMYHDSLIISIQFAKMTVVRHFQ